MSDPIVKGAKRNASRPAPQSASTKSSAKSRKVTTKSAQPKPKRSAAEKSPVRKAAPAKAAQAPKSPRSSAKTSGKPPARKSPAQTATKKAGAKPKSAPPKRTTSGRPERVKSTSRPQTAKSSSKSSGRRAQTARPRAAKSSAARPAKLGRAEPRKAPSRPASKSKTAPRPTPQPRQPSRDEAAALKAFERAHKEFARGNFAPARDLFRALIAQHSGVSEVTARARTYLTVAETRLRSESSLPRDPDTLYDRGVFEMNRGDFVAAQEMFERALKRDPSAADTHYALAAARARLGAVETAIRSLEQAVGLNPRLRVRAQNDTDLAALRNEPEFERIVFSHTQV